MKGPQKTPLLNALIRHSKQDNVPFHMPGHKQGRGVSRKFIALVGTSPFSVDLTELPGLDDLHNPTGPIKNAQIRAARLFGADCTYFLVNGTTVGIQAAIMSLCKPGEEILLPRDVHRSVMGACILAGVIPRFIQTQMDKEFGIACPSSVTDLKIALEKYSGVKAVFQTYPSYYGLAGALPQMAQIAHSLHIPLVVDEAHGAHFAFSNLLPATALLSGADISIQSTHKTLGAMTQASMLHTKGHLLDHGEIGRNLSILQTTSPSYLLMASLDATVGHMESSGRVAIERTIKISNWVRQKIKGLPGLRCLGECPVEGKDFYSIDVTKLYISVRDCGLTGYQAADILRREYNIQVELCDRFNILCMFSIGNNFSDAKRLIAALEGLTLNHTVRKPLKAYLNIGEIPIPKLVLTPREAWHAEKKTVLLKDAAGKIACEIIAPYPPGIPIICPGEEITSEVIELIRLFRDSLHSFHGAADPGLDRITVVDG